MSMNDPDAHRRMNLARDNFHPSNKTTRQNREAPPEEMPSSPPHASLPRDMRSAAQAPAIASRAFKFASGVAGSVASAAIRSAAGATRLAGKTGELFRSRTAAEDELGALIEASRYSVIATRFATLVGLTPEEEFTVRRSTPDRRIHQAGSDLVAEGENASRPMFIASGWACRTRVTAGRRQIVSLLLPGDGIALRSGSGSLSSTSVTSLTAVETVDARPLLEMADDPSRNPGIFAAMHRILTLEEEFLFNHVSRLGPMPPQQRLAHLLMELHWRQKQAGQATAREAPLPVGAETLGDILALKPSAVNSAMRHLQRRNLVRNTYGRISLLDAARLRDFSQFAPPAPMARTSTRRLIRDAGVPAPAIQSAKPVATSLPPGERMTKGRPASSV